MKTNIHFYLISLSSSENEKVFGKTLYRNSQHTFCVQKLFFPFENRAVYEIMWKILESGAGHR